MDRRLCNGIRGDPRHDHQPLSLLLAGGTGDRRGAAQPFQAAVRRASAAGPEMARIRQDTLVGMTFSNLVALFIVFAAAATLNAHGVTQIETAAQAAQAL